MWCFGCRNETKWKSHTTGSNWHSAARFLESTPDLFKSLKNDGQHFRDLEPGDVCIPPTLFLFFLLWVKCHIYLCDSSTPDTSERIHYHKEHLQIKIVIMQTFNMAGLDQWTWQVLLRSCVCSHKALDISGSYVMDLWFGFEWLCSTREQLTFPQVCIDAHISSSSSQTRVFSVWDVFLGLWVYVFFRQAKVYDVDGVLPFGAGSAHKEVLRLHVSIDQASGVDKLHTGYLRERTEQKRQSNKKKSNRKLQVLWGKKKSSLCVCLTSCMAIMSTVFRENVRSQRSNRSSKLGPSSSRTIALYLPHGPK